MVDTYSLNFENDIVETKNYFTNISDMMKREKK